MLGRVTIAGCLTALLLTPSFAQVQHTPPQHPAPHADGQWHRFQKEARPGEARPKEARPNPNRSDGARPPRNQPGHAGNWLRHYQDLPPAQQRRALENDPQFRRLTPQQQARLRNRLQHFSSLPPEQQQRVLNRMETWEHLTSDQKDRARQLFQQFKQLPPDRRQAVNRAIRGMRNLTPGQRDQLINSQEYMNSFSLQERVILSGAAHLPLAPGDGLQAAPPE
jgi:hypothetical protein